MTKTEMDSTMTDCGMKCVKKRFGRSARQRPRRSGAAALEFAVTAPTLLIVIFTCFEFARLAMMTSLAESAAYEGCRFAVVEGATTEDAVNEANRILSRLGTQDATVVVNDGVGISPTDREITLRISIPMDKNAFLLSGFFTDKLIVAEITLGTERYTGYYDGG
jgi:hypothetical protein